MKAIFPSSFQNHGNMTARSYSLEYPQCCVGPCFELTCFAVGLLEADGDGGAVGKAKTDFSRGLS